MKIKYFEDFTGEWLDVEANEGSTLYVNSDGDWSTTNGYRKLVAALTQSGTDAPTMTIYENTFGVTFTLSYIDVGRYAIEYTDLFTSNKTVVFVNNSLKDYVTVGDFLSNDAVRIQTFESDTLAYADSVLKKASIEIRVYN